LEHRSKLISHFKITCYTQNQEVISKYSEKGTKIIVCFKGRCKGFQDNNVVIEEGQIFGVEDIYKNNIKKEEVEK